MNNIEDGLICLDTKYSTTRRLTKKHPVIGVNPEDKFETTLFFPESELRQAEGGLRTQGYFKTSDPDKALITVITVVFNGEKFLEETILSIIGQSYDNVEYIIIDGGSTDGSVDIIRKYQHAIDYWVSESDEGMYDALNRGLQVSLGDVAHFMNSDDLFFSRESLQLIMNEFKATHFDCSYGMSNYIDESNKVVFSKKPLDFKVRYLQTLGLPFSQPTFTWRLDISKSVGGFNMDYKIVSDYDFIARHLLEAKKIVNIKHKLACFRVHGNSLGDNNASQASEEIKKIKRGFKKNTFPFLMGMYDRLIQKIYQYNYQGWLTFIFK